MASDTKQLKRIKRLEEEIKRRQAALMQTQARIKEKERKVRTRRLIEVGELAEIAGIVQADSAVLLGGFLRLAETLKDAATHTRLQADGQARLSQRKASQRKQAAT